MNSSDRCRIHPFNILLALVLLFIVLRFGLRGFYPLMDSPKDRFAESVRTTRSLVGKESRPIPAIVDDVQMVVKNLDVKTFRKIRVGDKDTTDSEMVIEILEIHTVKPFAGTVEEGESTRTAEPPTATRTVLLRLRFQTFLFLVPKISPLEFPKFKREPLIIGRSYTFSGPNYKVSGPIVHVDDFIFGGYPPELLYRMELAVKTRPVSKEMIQRIHPGDQAKASNVAIRLGTYAVLKQILQILPSESIKNTSRIMETYQLKLILECLCFQEKDVFRFDIASSPLKAGRSFMFKTESYELPVKIKGIRIIQELPPQQGRDSGTN